MIKTTEEAGITPRVTSGASRMIEPWGLRYFAKYEGDNVDDIADYGMVILNGSYYDSSYASNPDAMRLNSNAYVYTESEGTLAYDESGTRYYGTLTKDITSANIGDAYYVVPYVVLNDGSYVYGAVKYNSMLKIMNNNLNKDTVSETEKAVCRDIIALYEAVIAYHAYLDSAA